MAQSILDPENAEKLKSIDGVSDSRDLDDAKLIVAFETIANRRMTYDTLLWQVPVLSLTAQSFLFQIALGAGVSMYARFAAASLSFIAAIISMQLMAKHRYHEQIDSQALESLERQLELPPMHGKPHLRPFTSGNKPQGILLRFSSYKVWMSGLAMFALAGVAIMVYTFIRLV